ncbi:PAS domain S-box protein [Dyadobacter flavalbus]|uniref:histidine kinase n=1 Tax=Dyadobacter flavalbus TaxID=2579942 RepID=A0A5M8R093_9BACT|nr:ATP-binding protein [Dyadobacter flavalbus]KAA6441041.1 PAS domain S-box protein [Dyadobacter flavalbus]
MQSAELSEINYHRLLKRQIRKFLPEKLAADPALQDFLLSVHQAYAEFQDDLVRVEHILEQSSGELFKANRELSRIAQEKTAEAAVSSKRLQDVAASISEVLIQLDKQGKIVYLNHAWETITGYPVAESLDKKLTDFPVAPESKESIEETLNSSEAAVKGIFEITTADGSRKWLGISLSHHNSFDNQITGHIGTLADITERINAEKKLKSYMRDLERINAELDQFAYVVSHDLKAPLRAINNLSEWIEEDLADVLAGDTRDQFNLLRGRVHRMEGLINGILSYSRAGRIKTASERFFVKPVVDDLCETFSTKKPIEFVIEGNPELEIVSEKITLTQILQNLISNGIKYNDKPQIRIKVRWTEQESGLEFSVSDNGPGISPEYFEKIFVIFQTLQSRDEVESTGVGLAIVKKIIDEKGGVIRIESTMTEGTTFFFTWPKNESKQQDTAT